MSKRDRQAWFCARESGMSYYPVTWQGYAVLVGYVILLSAASLLIKRSWLMFFGATFAISIVLMIVVSMTSDDSSI